MDIFHQMVLKVRNQPVEVAWMRVAENVTACIVIGHAERLTPQNIEHWKASGIAFRNPKDAHDEQVAMDVSIRKACEIGTSGFWTIGPKKKAWLRDVYSAYRLQRHYQQSRTNYPCWCGNASPRVMFCPRHDTK